MIQPVDHSALIEQLEGWILKLESGDALDRDAVIREIRQVAADLTIEDAGAGPYGDTQVSD